MSIASRAIVESVLEGNPRGVLQAVRTSDPTSPDALAAQAVVACFEALRGDFTYDDARAALDASLATPTTDPELDLILVAHAVWAALQDDDPTDAKLHHQRLRDAAEHHPGRDAVRAWAHMADAWLAEAHAHHLAALDHIADALHLDLPATSVTWFNLKLMHAHHGLQCNDVNAVSHALTEIRARLASHDDLGRAAGPLPPARTARHWPTTARTIDDCLTWLTVRRQLITGEYEHAAETLDALSQQQQERHTPLVNHFRVILLAETSHFAQAERLLDAADTTRLDPGHADRTRAYLHALRGDFNAVTTHTDAVASDAPTALPDQPAALYRAWADMALGHIGDARRRLAQLDPDQRQPLLDFEWARLLLLEDDEQHAAIHLRRFLARASPGQLERALKLAPELTAYHFARLQRLAESLPDDDEPAAAPAEADAAEDAAPSAAPAPSVSVEAVEQRLIGSSRVMEDVRQWVRRFAWIERFARLNTTVLIMGETGTGKEVVARLLRDVSGRANEPFTAINCGGLTDTLIESELFGHVRGAFTGATRDYPGLFISTGGGTIFLDEVNAMSPRLQAALLRVLESGEVRPVGGSKIKRIKCRVFAAANESLENAMKEGRFRSDLYYRLSGLTIELPALRERREDIEPLARHFLTQLVGQRDMTLSSDLLEAMRQYDWPGNVRELRNEVEHIALMAGDRSLLTPDMFRKAPPRSPDTPRAGSSPTSDTPDSTHPTPTPAGASDTGRDATASQPAHNAAPPAPAAQPANANPIPVPTIPPELMGNLRNAQVRRRILRHLFDHYEQFTRAEIIDLLQCAPNTATRDLKALTSEGYIKRIHTSGHLRTSYFQRVRDNDDHDA